MRQYIKDPAPVMPPPGHRPPPAAKTHGLAVAALLMGLGSVVFFPAAILGIVFGIVSLGAIKKSAGTLKGRGMAIAGLVTSLLMIAFIVLGFIFVLNSDTYREAVEKAGKTGQRVDPNVTLSLAERNVVSSADGIAYSNSEAGYVLAKAFALSFKEIAMEASDSIRERDDFVTHCQLHEDSVAFIVHVPKLRKFDEASKGIFCELAWNIAFHTLDDAGIAEGIDLAVGVKGIMLYEDVQMGTFATNVDGEVSNPSRTNRTEDALEAYFKSPPALPGEGNERLEGAEAELPASSRG